jgi:hypothetical protein
MCKRQPKPEAGVQRAILDLLAAERIFAIRLNTGAFRNAQGRPIFMHSAGAGVADIVAFPSGRVLWVEAKAPAGRQTPKQVSFQQRVESEGHAYIVARSSDDVLAYLRAVSRIDRLHS